MMRGRETDNALRSLRPILAALEGFEPPTPALGRRRSIQLSYRALRATTRRARPPPIRVLKKSDLPRWRARSLAAMYLEYTSRGPLPAAWHLDLFEQPGKSAFSASR
jgi:hypothetical protein